jgi:NADH-quinone oxidoreductase subunit M
MLSDRRHTRQILEFGGLKAVMPRLVAVFLLITLASIGLPGLNGFVGEFLILLGAFRWDPRFAAFAASGVILSAVYMLWMFQRVNYGPVTNDENLKLPDLTVRERWVIIPAVAMTILMGVLPGIFLKPMQPSVDLLLQRLSRTVVAQQQRGPAAGHPAAADQVAAPVAARVKN